MNGKRSQDVNIDCTSYSGTPLLDYMSHKRQIRGSILANANIYDDFCDFSSIYDQQNKGELISGIPMSVAPLTCSFVGVNMRAAQNAFQHYTWFVFVKKLTMSLGVVMVQ